VTTISEQKQLPTKSTTLPVKPAVWLFQERMQDPVISSNCNAPRHQKRIIPCGLWGGGTPKSLPPSWNPGTLTAALSINIIQSRAPELCGSLHSGWKLLLCGGQQLLTFLRNQLTWVSPVMWVQAPKGGLCCQLERNLWAIICALTGHS